MRNGRLTPPKTIRQGHKKKTHSNERASIYENFNLPLDELRERKKPEIPFKHRVKKFKIEDTERLKITENYKKYAEEYAKHKQIKLGDFSGFRMTENYLKMRKKKERERGYWQRRIKTQFRPKVSEDKKMELEFRKFKERKPEKRSFKLIPLDQMIKEQKTVPV